jgi:O-antigen ligase
MDQSHSTKNIFSLIYFLLFLSFITGLVFSLRAVSSTSTALLLLTGVIGNRSFPREKKIFFFLLVSLLFVLLQIISMFYTQDQRKGLTSIIIASSVFITPLAMYSTGYLNRNTTKDLLKIFCILLAAALLYCLANAFIQYNRTGHSSFFFYHQLVHPIKQHAVYFSILLFTGIVFCGELIRENQTGKMVWPAIAFLYFTGFLFLLSSKLVIAFFVIYLFYFSISAIKKRTNRLKARLSLTFLVLLAACIVLLSKNPISNRFADLLRGDSFNKEQYSSDEYLNGLQFRLLQWRLVPEILDENRSWIAGVSPGDAQDKLIQKYLSKKLYAGDPANNDPGYLIYNTHNQFLQSLLENGIIGLLVFSLLFFAVIKMTWHKKKLNGMSFVILLLLTYCFTESILKTQYGVILFTFLPLLPYYYYYEEENKPA